MKKVTILALHLGFGGIEKCIANLANSICDDFNVEIISVYKMYEETAFEINDKVKVKYLIENYKPNREEWINSIKNIRPITFIKESYKSIVTLFLRGYKMINAIKKCDSDVIISSRILFNNWLGKYGHNGTKKIGWEHNHHRENVKYIEKMVKSCKNLDEVVFVSDSLRSFYKKELKNKNYKCKARYIPNSLDYIPEKVSKLNSNRLVSIGRFSKEKGFPDLIDVFNEAYKKNNKLTLDLIGDGTQRNMIVDKIYQYGLEKVVNVHGYLSKEEINKILEKSSLYLMTSFTESFGLVLIEAMSFGIPCISFSSAEGARDLIKDNDNGYLIKDRNKEKMADKIIELTKNKIKLKELGKNAREFSLNYKQETVKKLWIKIIK